MSFLPRQVQAERVAPPPHDQEPYFVLAADGGGLNAIIQMRVLQHMEALAASRGLSRPLFAHFNEVAAISSAAIWSMALSTPMGGALGALPPSLSDVVTFYEAEGRNIFRQPEGRIKTARKTVEQFYRPKYSDADLNRCLRTLFGEAVMLEANAHINVLFWDETQGRMIVASTRPRCLIEPTHTHFSSAEYRVFDAVRGAVAAPTKLSAHIFSDTEGTHIHTAVDAAVGMNTPVLPMLAKLRAEGVDTRRVHILSIGTGSKYQPFTSGEVACMGLQWALHTGRGESPLYERQTRVATHSACDTAQSLLGDRFLRLDYTAKADETLPAIDDPSPAAFARRHEIALGIIESNAARIEGFVEHMVAREQGRERIWVAEQMKKLMATAPAWQADRSSPSPSRAQRWAGLFPKFVAWG